MDKYIRTKDGKIFNLFDLVKWNKTQGLDTDEISFWNSAYRHPEKHKLGLERRILKQAYDIAELVDEIVLIENGNEHNIVYLQEAYDRIDEYREQGNYEPRLIGRIKVGLDKKAVAEWKENEQGLYDWVLL